MKMKNMPRNIRIDEIHAHPDNPRKDVGDVTELAESIKKNGIMQNLTVMPGHWTDGIWIDTEYTVLIGHRRCAASKMAGLTEVPCRIVEEIGLAEQIAIMLEENMQRNDLTVFEQAQSFQMMLDLGETVNDLVEKTGFSKTTIYHRLNIAKLDQETLHQKEEDDSFQLDIKDLYALEQIKSIEKRNELLKQAYDSKSLRAGAKRIALEEERDKSYEKCKAMIPNCVESKGLAPWTDGYKILKSIPLDNIPDEITLDTAELPIYIGKYYERCLVAVKEPKTAKKKRQKKKRSLMRIRRYFGNLLTSSMRRLKAQQSKSS